MLLSKVIMRKDETMKRKYVGIFIALVVVACIVSAVLGLQNQYTGGSTAKTKRTIMLYDCGADLETSAAMATYNIEQILKANFSKDEGIRFIVMTGGSNQWQLDKDYLVFPEGNNVPDDAVAGYDPQIMETTDEVLDKYSQVSNVYNQVWEAKGLDAAVDPGKMVLIDGDGLGTGGESAAVKSSEELMSDPDTLKSFINFCVQYAPAEKYDLILWDHGGGPTYGFGMDEHQSVSSFWDSRSLMTFPQIMDALSENDVTKGGGKFDLVDFDACLMSSVELDLVLADYTNYYIASPETEPGYGQYYTGWLDMLGAAENHEVDTFALGKKIVDDFYDFYDKGEGQGQDGTLAIIDMNKLTDPKNGFVDALKKLDKALKEQASTAGASGEFLFYDEFMSMANSIEYGDSDYYDLGNIASLLSLEYMEVTEDDDNSLYKEAGTEINRLLQLYEQDDPDDPDNRNGFIYARGTEGITTDMQLFRKADGDLDYDTLGTSGMYLYFPDPSAPMAYIEYYNEMGKVIEKLPEGDARREFLDSYRHTLIDYALIAETGTEVGYMLRSGEKQRSEIDYAAVKADWQEWMDDPEMAQYAAWNMRISTLLNEREGGIEEAEAWLSDVVRQQAEEGLSNGSVSAKRILTKDGRGYEVTISDTKKRVISDVSWELNAEMPAFDKYIKENLDEEEQNVVEYFGRLSLGRIKGQEVLTDMPSRMGYDSELDYNHALAEWYNRTENTWTLEEVKDKWYAVEDADGVLHVASYEEDDEKEGAGYVPATIGIGHNNQLVLLYFEDNELTQVHFLNENTGWRPVKVKDLVGEIEVMPVMYVSFFGLLRYYIPISDSMFKLSAKNARNISLVYRDIDEIKDIADADGDGVLLNTYAEVSDIYGGGIDITETLDKPDENLVHIELARVTPASYTGEEVKPVVTYRGKTLKEGKDYTLVKLYNEAADPEPVFKEPGKYTIMLFGEGNYRGYEEKDFYIVPPEEKLNRMLKNAEEDVAEAQLRVDLLSDSDSAKEVESAYRQLVKAQQKLIEAEEMLILSKEII